MKLSVKEAINMKRKLFAILVVASALSLALVQAACTPSRDVDDADGVWCYLPAELEPIKVVSRNSVWAVPDVGDWTGTFTGTSEDYGVVVEHAFGHALFIGTVSFDSVDVGGTSGGLEMHAVGERAAGKPEWEGTWKIIGASGELEGLRGQGTWWGPGWSGDYEECGVIYYLVEEMGTEND